MGSNVTTRASDADRDRIAAALGGHHAAGRLTLEEFKERLDAAYAAKTLGQLDDLMADLPGADLDRLPSASLRRAGDNPPLARQGSRASVEVWRSWFAISIAVFMIWLLSGVAGAPWFLWVVVPLGALMLGRWIARGRHQDRRHPNH